MFKGEHNPAIFAIFASFMHHLCSKLCLIGLTRNRCIFQLLAFLSCNNSTLIVLYLHFLALSECSVPRAMLIILSDYTYSGTIKNWIRISDNKVMIIEYS